VVTLAIDQNQGLVRRQAAQACRADVIGAVDTGRAWEVQAGGDAGKALGQFGRALGLQALRRDDIDGRQGIEARPAAGALTGDDDFGGLFICRRRGLGGTLCEGGGRKTGRQAEDKGGCQIET